jgi:hypothetical protein
MSIESSEQTLGTLRIFLVIFTSLVAIGLVLEYKTPLYLIARGLLKFVSFKSNSFDRCALRRMCWHFLGALLVTIGVAGEFVVEYEQTGAESDLSRASAEARENLNAEAARAREDAAKIKAENLKLEAQITPRRLDLDQQVKIAENCKGSKNLFMGKRIKLVSYSLDTESFVLAEQIVEVLRASGMTVDDEAMSITPMMGNLVFGINVFGSDPELAKKIAEAIGSSGKPIAVGFTATDPTAGTMRVETDNSRLPHEATVLVGLKPFDANTANELMRIMKPRVKPAKP